MQAEYYEIICNKKRETNRLSNTLSMALNAFLAEHLSAVNA